MKLLRTIALAAVLAMAGCATIFNGTSQRIQVISEPPGAEVFLDGELGRHHADRDRRESPQQRTRAPRRR